jgi:hypothetical protein
MERKIVKVKLIEGTTPLISFVTGEGRKKAKTTIESKTPVHDDFKSAFAGLTLHFTLLAGFVDISEIKQFGNPPKKATEDFRVSGYSIGGADDDPGIIITGIRTLKNGKTVTVNTPFTRFNEETETGYKFIDQLLESIDRVEKESAEYLDNGKSAPDPQMSMFEDHDESPNGIDSGIDTKTASKRGRKKTADEPELVDA